MENHPSREIIGTKGNELRNKRIALCITGSVAAIRAPELARLLMRHGCEVHAVMSAASKVIIHPNVMEWATGNPVVTELSGKIEHIDLGGKTKGRTDLILIAPSTANTISKIAAGIDDTPVTSVISVAFGSGIPIIIVPAMHECMYRHPILVENMKKLRALDVEFVEPIVEEGKAKIADNEIIVEAVIRRLGGRDLAGRRVLVTAGPTMEYIDPIRIVTNKSSGRMGMAMALEAYRRGADVTVVGDLEQTNLPSNISLRRSETTQEMREAVEKSLESERYDFVIAAAAVADYMPTDKRPNKIATRDVPELTLRLVATPKIIDMVKQMRPQIFLVGFKAEHGVSDEELLGKGEKFLRDSKIDLLILNDVGRPGSGFRVMTNEIFIMGKNGETTHVPLSSKTEIAKKVWDKVIALAKVK
ncbi:MAG TPA: bifunctional phosphopantothenoylcysteine decarboxylase/phosphopantothenate--cysteine ligase CoaBC [Candidatus Bathyarchaeia archaeon]|nr:bifunctional phosphopantothenoylcysteine decarboxylase/phosphopantothenate--cysteine ligase CoaBC [Candidatus Bathyarchaeia archaeon]